MLLYGKPLEFDQPEILPEGWAATGHAMAAAAVMTFSLTHNPLFHMLVVPAIIAFFTGPFWGGMMAAGKAKLNHFGAFLCALAVAAADAGFIGFVWLCAYAVISGYPYIAAGNEWASQLLTMLGWATVVIAIYSFFVGWIGVYAGIRARRNDNQPVR